MGPVPMIQSRPFRPCPIPSYDDVFQLCSVLM
jgi:hypothetical protein